MPTHKQAQMRKFIPGVLASCAALEKLAKQYKDEYRTYESRGEVLENIMLKMKTHLGDLDTVINPED